jgi:2-iminobutanoate/2-iminopropanoate deaminase
VSAASRPVGPYTPVVVAGDWLIASGQLGLDDGTMVDGGTGAQLTQAIANLAGLLAGAGAGLSDVVKTTVFLADIGDYTEMNDAYVAAFGDHRPARSAVAVAALPLGARVEIEAWAFTGGGRTDR